MYLLDTNVVSVLDSRRRRESIPVVDWIERNGPSVFLSVATLMEVERGILKLRRLGNGQRADGLSRLLAGIVDLFGDRILVMNNAIAFKAAKMDESARAFSPGLVDIIIGATADVHGLVLLTRNVRHFAPMGVNWLNPFLDLPPET